MLPIESSDQGATLKFWADTGLYQFSVIADASEFNWSDLYVELTEWNNNGKRSGPWDFNPLQNNYPVLPSYWVYLDGHRIGLWFFSRVSLEDLAAKRFRGRMACWLREPGQHELKFVPYRPIHLRWISARLEADPEDSLLSESDVQQNASARPLASQEGDEEFWAQKRDQLSTTHANYREPLNRAFEHVTTVDEPGPNTWIALIAAHRLEKYRGALEALLNELDIYIDRPHWGNPREDGYSHDGDMHAAFTLRAFARVYHTMGEELGGARRARLLAKLVHQGERFLELTLLNRDYWGGSLRQDHGWRSIHTMCYTSLALQGVVPQATQWLRYFLPRAKRSLAVIPQDGLVPESSHHSLVLFLDDITDLRDALLAWNGEDIYDKYPFHRVVDYVSDQIGHGVGNIGVGGNGFFNQMASKFRDGRAVWIQQRLLETDVRGGTISRRQGYYADIIRGFLTFDPSVPPEKPPAPKALEYFDDRGMVRYTHAGSGIIFEVRCGPRVGYHAEHHLICPCDLSGSVPAEGHFTVHRGKDELIVAPDSGYALWTQTRNSLLIDGKGQHGDIGYPMSIPSKRHRGETIEHVDWVESTQTGLVRLNLTPAYDEETTLAHYTREFLFTPHDITIRDHVVLSRPKVLSWLFHGRSENGVEMETADASATVSVDGGTDNKPVQPPCRVRFGTERGITLEAHAVGTEVDAALHETPVVYGYASSLRTYQHVRYNTSIPVDCATVEFTIRW
jgi:hypothetical protein